MQSQAPDVETASHKYKKRFASKTGQWFLKQQLNFLLSMISPWPSASILDVGGGHGQYTKQLIDNGYSISVMGSSTDANTQIRELISDGQCQFSVGNFNALPFADNSFDIVISFRLMTHLEEWEDLIRESCRVAKHAVIIDFPITKSLNATYPLFFKLKKKLEGGSTRPFFVFDEVEVVQLLQKVGFAPTARQAQYFFPMVFHRVLNWSQASKHIERACRFITLTDRFGSPIILMAEPDSKGKNTFA